MTIIQSLSAFIVAAGLLTIAPGLDTAPVLPTATVEAPKRAALAALGIKIGCLSWGHRRSISARESRVAPVKIGPPICLNQQYLRPEYPNRSASRSWNSGTPSLRPNLKVVTVQ